MKIRLELGEMKVELEGDQKDIKSAIKIFLEKSEKLATLQSSKSSSGSKAKTKTFASSLSARLEGLIVEGFFDQPRFLGEIKQKLQELGYHYPRTTIAPAILQMIRQRQLRRIGSPRKYQYVKP